MQFIFAQIPRKSKKEGRPVCYRPLTTGTKIKAGAIVINAAV
jgi:hypothetical protein